MSKCMVPNCEKQNPSKGHYRLHERKGELMRRVIRVGKRWGLVWMLPEKAAEPQGGKEA